LVALHLANAGLLHQETTAAVAAGVNAMLSSSTTVAICQLQVRLLRVCMPHRWIQSAIVIVLASRRYRQLGAAKRSM
jgi:hypothetical protein